MAQFYDHDFWLYIIYISSENNLRLANNKTDDLTIKKLSYGNHTMKAQFDWLSGKGG